MFAFPGTWKVYLAVEPVDMRKHFDGLWAQAELHLGESPRLGALFVFANKERNWLKMLYWDGYATSTNMGQCDSRKMVGRRTRAAKAALCRRILKRFEKRQNV